MLGDEGGANAVTELLVLTINGVLRSASSRNVRHTRSHICTSKLPPIFEHRSFKQMNPILERLSDTCMMQLVSKSNISLSRNEREEKCDSAEDNHKGPEGGQTRGV